MPDSGIVMYRLKIFSGTDTDAKNIRVTMSVLIRDINRVEYQY